MLEFESDEEVSDEEGVDLESILLELTLRHIFFPADTSFPSELEDGEDVVVVEEEVEEVVVVEEEEEEGAVGKMEREEYVLASLGEVDGEELRDLEDDGCGERRPLLCVLSCC